MVDPLASELLILPRLADLLEAALELVSAVDAMERLEEVHALAGQVQAEIQANTPAREG